MAVRRIVTGNPQGRSRVVSDCVLPGIEFRSVPGFSQTSIWSTEGAPSHPDATAEPVPSTVLPAPGSTRFLIVTFPPDSVTMSPDFDPAAAGLEYAEHLKDFAACFEPDAPGMHVTPTVDYGILLSGGITLELDDNTTTSLNVGDVVIQNGTRHAWRNPGDVPAVMAFVLIGANSSQQ